jgi:esterase/lipase
VTDWVAAERYYERLGSRCKKLRFYDTSGHALTVDRDYQQITADIIEFVQSLTAGQKHEF